MNRLEELKNELKERIEDHYYADTWEYAAQISKEIAKIKSEISRLENTD